MPSTVQFSLACIILVNEYLMPQSIYFFILFDIFPFFTRSQLYLISLKFFINQPLNNYITIKQIEYWTAQSIPFYIILWINILLVRMSQKGKQTSFDDMCSIQNLTEESIFSNLSNRYQNDQIFTFIGPILLAINPYRTIPQSFNEDLLKEIIQETLMGRLRMTPHIYVLAARAFSALINRQQTKQSIIISGESGAGKTESTKYCMQVLTKLSKKKTSSIEEKILACNPLLEAFGNSKTVRNQNSSRFGKYVQIFFGKDLSIKGANIQSYLLEKSRVSMVGKNQRNFHAFYALTASGHFGASPASTYKYLSKSECYNANNINDKQLFDKVIQSLNEIGFSQEQQDKIWKLLLVILQLGNLEFDDKRFLDDANNNSCQVVNKSSMCFILQTLQVQEPYLQALLLKRNSGGFKNNASKMDCEVNRDTLSKAIYSCIFQTIIDKIQVVLSPSNQSDSFEPACYEINLLDIFGFQNFESNSLEQICINFANEKLLSQYNQKIFENQLKILREDGLQEQVKGIQQPTNKQIISSIKTIFNAINESTKQRFYNETNMMSAFKKQFENKPHSLVQFKKTNQNIFILKHSPCTVHYCIEGFKLKNQDELTPEINEVCTKLFPYSSALPLSKKVRKDDKTIISKFNEKIDELIYRLSESQNHFVRCIKPNDKKRSKYIEASYMTTQIRYLGVFETIKIRQSTFPYRKTFEDFYNKYKEIVPQAKGKTNRQGTRFIVNKIQALQECYLFGNNRIYMNKELASKLQALFLSFISKKIEKVIYIQKRFRAIFARGKFRAAVEEILKRMKKEKKMKRLDIFGRKCFEILSKIKEDRLFHSIRYIERYDVHIQNNNSNQIKSAIIPGQGIKSNIQQSEVSRKKPYQFPTNENFMKNAQEQFYQQIQHFEEIIAQKQSQLLQQQHQKAQLFSAQTALKKQIQILSASLQQKQYQNHYLQEQIAKCNNDLTKSLMESSQIKILLSEKQSQLRILLQQKQEAEWQRIYLKQQLTDRQKTISELISDKNAKIEQAVKQYKSKCNRLEQQHKMKDESLKEQRNVLHSLAQKNQLYQAIIKDYQAIIVRYKQQQSEFFKQKQMMHQQILQKCKIIEQVKNKHQPRSQSIKNQQISKLQQRIGFLQKQLSQNFNNTRKSKMQFELQISSQMQLDMMTTKMKQLQQKLKDAQAKITLLEISQQQLNAKIREMSQRNLRQTAEYNNKINMANQKFKNDKFTIDQLRKSLKELKAELSVSKTRITQLQMLHSKQNNGIENAQQIQISEKELINFIRYYNKKLSQPQRHSLKQEIVRTIDQI